MIQYIRENFSTPFFLSYLLIYFSIFIPTVLKIEKNLNYLNYEGVLYYLLILFHLFDLRKKIGDEGKISFGKFSLSYVGGSIFCALTLVPFYLIIMIFTLFSNFSQLDKLGPVEFKFNFFTDYGLLPLIFFFANIYYPIAFSNCIYRLKTTFKFKALFQIFSFKEFKFFFIFFLFTVFLRFGLIWISKHPSFSIAKVYLDFFTNPLLIFFVVIQFSYLVKLQSENFSDPLS